MALSLFERLAERVINRGRSRSPDFIIGGDETPYLYRWWLTPWSRCYRDVRDEDKTPWQRFVLSLPGVYLHCFLRSDDDRALHDHPWLWNATLILQGQYLEHTIAAGGIHRKAFRRAGDFKFRWGPAPHRVELLVERRPGGVWVPAKHPGLGRCWTLFFTGFNYREWGFHCPERGWVHWREFTAPDDAGQIGRGCDA